MTEANKDYPADPNSQFNHILGNQLQGISRLFREDNINEAVKKWEGMISELRQLNQDQLDQDKQQFLQRVLEVNTITQEVIQQLLNEYSEEFKPKTNLI